MRPWGLAPWIFPGTQAAPRTLAIQHIPGTSGSSRSTPARNIPGTYSRLKLGHTLRARDTPGALPDIPGQPDMPGYTLSDIPGNPGSNIFRVHPAIPGIPQVHSAGPGHSGYPGTAGYALDAQNNLLSDPPSRTQHRGQHRGHRRGHRRGGSAIPRWRPNAAHFSRPLRAMSMKNLRRQDAAKVARPRWSWHTHTHMNHR